MSQSLFTGIAKALSAKANCEKFGNKQWSDIWETMLETMCAELPSGSGFDSGTKLADNSTPDKLIFTTAFHHMNDGGYYDGWTEHTVTIRPSFALGYTLTVSGRNRRDIKEYIGDVFSSLPDIDFDTILQDAIRANDPANYPATVAVSGVVSYGK